MQVEAVRMNGHYFIPALDNQGLKKERIKFDIPDKTIKKIIKDDAQEKIIEYSDEYIEKHWQEMIMTSVDNSDYYKSDQYYNDRIEDYKIRGKI